MLDLSVEQQNALAQRHVIRRFFVWCEARDPDTGEPDPAGFWDDVGDVELDGKIYQGSGSLAQIGSLNASTELTVPSQDIVLNGVSQAGVAYVRGKALSQAPITISLGIFDPETRELIGDLIPRFVGWVDDVSIDTPAAGGESTITITCQSTQLALTVKSSDTRSDASQKVIDPTDRFYEYTGVQREKPLYFGQATPDSATS